MTITKAQASRLARTCFACVDGNHGDCWIEVAVRYFGIGPVRVPCACARRHHLTAVKEPM